MKHLFIAACCCLASAGFAAEPFEIRGVLPWHNFLCGPTAWNKADYEVYLDNCKIGRASCRERVYVLV